MPVAFAVLFFPVFLIVATMIFAGIFFSDEICKPAIHKWAIKEKIDYVFDEAGRSEESLFPDLGPFRFRKLNNQRVYRLMVTINGQQKAAYVRVGHWLLGLLHPVVVMRFKNVSEQSRATRTFGPSDSI